MAYLVLGIAAFAILSYPIWLTIKEQNRAVRLEGELIEAQAALDRALELRAAKERL